MEGEPKEINPATCSKPSEETMEMATPTATSRSVAKLSPSVVRNISTGQMVQNIASACKELIENALDSGATMIEIKVADYGVKSLEVSDNGSGVKQEDFEALAQSHWTSKLGSFDDLNSLKTYGFRGEALSVLAALSKMTIVTRDCSVETACKLTFDNAGRLESKSPCARTVGTTVTITDFLEPLPVRRKEFERNAKNEYQRLLHVVQSFCLIARNVGIQLSHRVDNASYKPILNTHQNKTMKENVCNVFGAKQLESLIEYVPTTPSEHQLTENGFEEDAHVNNFKVEGFVSTITKGAGRSAADRQFIYINERPCEVGKILRTVNDVYRNYNQKQYPVVILNVKIEDGKVDVNLVPDKRRVLISEERVLCLVIAVSLKTLYDQLQGIYSVGEAASSSTSIAANVPVVNRPASSVTTAASSSSSSSCQRVLSSFKYTSTRKEADRSKTTTTTTAASKSVVAAASAALGEIVSREIIATPPMTPRKQSRGNDGRPMAHAPLGNVGFANTFAAANSSPMSTDRRPAPLTFLLNTRRFARGENSAATGDNAADAIAVARKPTMVRFADEVANDENNTTNDAGGGGSLRTPSKKKRPSNEQDEEEQQETTTSVAALFLSSKSRRRNQHSSMDDSSINSSISDRLIEDAARQAVRALYQPAAARQGGENDAEIVVTTPQQFRAPKVPTTPRREQQSSTSEKPLRLEPGWTGSRKCCALPFSIDELRRYKEESAEQMEMEIEEDGDGDEGGPTAPEFCAKITPEDNKNAEQELKRCLKRSDFSAMQVIGQFNRGFIIARLRDDLFIIDQHASDEKYNFEVIQRKAVFETNSLLNPIPLELSAMQEQILMDRHDVFTYNGFGFLADDTKPPGRRFSVTTIPRGVSITFERADIEEILAILADDPHVKMYRPKKVHHIFASKACRKSVMIGTALNKSKMETILRHLAETEQPWNCPHGRPTVRHLLNLRQIQYLRSDE